MCSHLNPLTEAILVSTHIIPFSVKKKKENHPILFQICSCGILFQGTQKQGQNSHGKQAMDV